MPSDSRKGGIEAIERIGGIVIIVIIVIIDTINTIGTIGSIISISLRGMQSRSEALSVGIGRAEAKCLLPKGWRRAVLQKQRY